MTPSFGRHRKRSQKPNSLRTAFENWFVLLCSRPWIRCSCSIGRRPGTRSIGEWICGGSRTPISILVSSILLVEPAQTKQFEDAFRTEVIPGGKVERACRGRVLEEWWKFQSERSHYSRSVCVDRHTGGLDAFCRCVEEACRGSGMGIISEPYPVLWSEVRLCHTAHVPLVLRSAEVSDDRQKDRNVVVPPISQRTAVCLESVKDG